MSDKRIQSNLEPWQMPVVSTASRDLLSDWTHAVEDILQSAKEQRAAQGEAMAGRHVCTRDELVKSAGALLLMVQMMDEDKREGEG